MVIAFKAAGFVCVLFSTGYFAYSLSRTLESRVSELRKIYSILLQLKSEIQYMNATLPECFLKMSDNQPEPFVSWLHFLSERTEQTQEKNFNEIWQEGLEVLRKRSVLCDEDISPLKELGDKLGSMDITAQLKAVDYALLHLERNRTALEDEMAQKKKVVVTLSLFCGFMTLILLL